STFILDIGNHAVTAAYSGDSIFGSSTSPTVTQTVTGTVQVWKGGALGDATSWSNPANWVLGVVPEASDSVLFTNGPATSVTAVVDAAFGGVVARLTVDPSWNGTITVNRSLAISSGMNLAGGNW